MHSEGSEQVAAAEFMVRYTIAAYLLVRYTIYTYNSKIILNPILYHCLQLI